MEKRFCAKRARVLSIFVAVCIFIGCAPLSLPARASNSEMLDMAKAAYEDMLRLYWRGGPETGHLMREFQGLETDGQQSMIWAHAQMIFAFEALYGATGDEEIAGRIAAQWEFTKSEFTVKGFAALWGYIKSFFTALWRCEKPVYTREILTRPGENPNTAVDDAGWDAMAYMTFYRVTGDEAALDYAGKLIRNSYEYWKDGDTANGLWYPYRPPNHGGDGSSRFKSIYAAALMVAALDYMRYREDERMMRDTMNLYAWTEENLCRRGQIKFTMRPGGEEQALACGDNLYFVDYNQERDGRVPFTGPDGAERPLDIREGGSVSSLFGNMAMGVIHARLYRLTGDEGYKTRALETVAALHAADSPYNNNGVYLNDRDAWTNAAFFRQWVGEVLTLDGITQADRDMVTATAKSIFASARVEGGYLGPWWSGQIEGTGWRSDHTWPQQLMTSATGAHVIMAAALLENTAQKGAGSSVEEK